jgi:DNA polymerase-3 subunit beta
VYKGLPKYPAVPVLAGMLLSVSEQRLTLAVFDYQQSRRVTVPGEEGPAKSGEILVDGRVLKKLLGTLPAADVELVAEDAVLTVTAGASAWRLPALPRSEYPALPDMPAETGVLVGPSFARSVTRVAAAASKDGTLPALTGINFTTRPGYLELAATDRYRLAVDRPSWTAADPDAKSLEALLPAAALTEFAKTAGKADKVSVGLSGELAGFSDGVHELIVHSISTDHSSKGAHARYLKYLRGTSPMS